MCRQYEYIFTPFLYSYSTAKWSQMLPTSFGSPTLPGRRRPPMPTALTGWSPMTQLITSRLWTCCSTMWSPHSHRKWYQLWSWYAASVSPGRAVVEPDAAAPFHEQRAATMSPIAPSWIFLIVSM